jgi:hypothetical protein
MLSAALFSLLPFLAVTAASPAPLAKRWSYEQYFDLQGHRGGRGETIEK